MANNTQNNGTRVKVYCRISFANIWEPKVAPGASEAKYSVSCIIPKSDVKTITAIEKAVEAAKENGKASKWSGKIPANLKLPLRDGDTDRPDDEAYQDCYFLNATNKDQPKIVDRRVKEITDPMEVGSGDYCNVMLNAFPYNSNGSKGVSFSLGNIQLVEHGERLAGRTSPEDDFEALDGGAVLEEDAPDFLG